MIDRFKTKSPILFVDTAKRPDDFLLLNLKSSEHALVLLAREELVFQQDPLIAKRSFVIIYRMDSVTNESKAWIEKFHQLKGCRVIVISNSKPTSFSDLYQAGAEIVFISPVVLYLLERAFAAIDIDLVPVGASAIRHPRVPISLPVELKAENQRPIFAKVENLSYSGMFLSFNYPRKLESENQKVAFELFLPGDKGITSIDGEAQIRWRRTAERELTAGIGAEFADLHYQSREQLTAFVNTLRTS